MGLLESLYRAFWKLRGEGGVGIDPPQCPQLSGQWLDPKTNRVIGCSAEPPPALPGDLTSQVRIHIRGCLSEVHKWSGEPERGNHLCPAPVLVLQLCHHEQMRALRLRGWWATCVAQRVGRAESGPRQPVPTCHLLGSMGPTEKGQMTGHLQGEDTEALGHHQSPPRPSQPTALRLQCQGCQ